MSGLHGKINLTAPGPYWLIIVPHVHFLNCQHGPLENYGDNDFVNEMVNLGSNSWSAKALDLLHLTMLCTGFLAIFELTWPKDYRNYSDFSSSFPGLISSHFTLSAHLPLCPWPEYFAIAQHQRPFLLKNRGRKTGYVIYTPYLCSCTSPVICSWCYYGAGTSNISISITRGLSPSNWRSWIRSVITFQYCRSRPFGFQMSCVQWRFAQVGVLTSHPQARNFRCLKVTF